MEADEKFFVNFSDCNELLAIVRLNELVEKEGRLGGKEGGEGESLRKIGARDRFEPWSWSCVWFVYLFRSRDRIDSFDLVERIPNIIVKCRFSILFVVLTMVYSLFVAREES